MPPQTLHMGIYFWASTAVSFFNNTFINKMKKQFASSFVPKAPFISIT